MQYARFIGGIASRITPINAEGRPAQGLAVSCWTRSLSPLAAVVSCGARLSRGQKLVIQLADIGGYLGQVERPVEGGYAIKLLLDDEAKERLSAKIAWHRKHVLKAAVDHRNFRRWRPAVRQTTMLLADGTAWECALLDVSASGVAVASSLRPDIGTPLAIGQLVGKVVRHRDEGFAVQFLFIQQEDSVESALLPLQASSQAQRADEVPA